LGLADVARFGQRAEPIGMVWHVAVLHEAQLRDMECTQLGPSARNCEWVLRNCESVSLWLPSVRLRLPSFPKRRG
jgi:hypothetical protein